MKYNIYLRVMRSQCRFNEYFFKTQVKKQRMSNCSTPITPPPLLLCRQPSSWHEVVLASLSGFSFINDSYLFQSLDPPLPEIRKAEVCKRHIQRRKLGVGEEWITKLLGVSEGPKQEPCSSFRSCWWVKAGAPSSTTPAVPSPKSVCVGGTDSGYDPFLLERPEIWPLVDTSLTQLLQERLVIPWGQIEQQPEVTNEQNFAERVQEEGFGAGVSIQLVGQELKMREPPTGRVSLPI